MNPEIPLPENLLQLAKSHFNLLRRENNAHQSDSVSLRLCGYNGVGHLISNIVKVCILALGDGDPYADVDIEQPGTHVSGVLSIILDLMPYEEFELLDTLREMTFNPIASNSAEPDNIFLGNVFLDTPAWLLQEIEESGSMPDLSGMC